jgi:hypothetical protein
MTETTLETTETIEIEESEEEALILEPENKGLSYSTLLVCCHNTIDALLRILPSPLADWSIHNIYSLLSIIADALIETQSVHSNAPLFDSIFVALTEMDRFPVLPNPSVTVDIYALSPVLFNPDVNFFMWNSSPYLNLAIVLNINVQNVSSNISRTIAIWLFSPISPALSRSVENPNLYNESPAILITVEETA